jgi:hypothetical protein
MMDRNRDWRILEESNRQQQEINQQQLMMMTIKMTVFARAVVADFNNIMNDFNNGLGLAFAQPSQQVRSSPRKKKRNPIINKLEEE